MLVVAVREMRKSNAADGEVTRARSERMIFKSDSSHCSQCDNERISIMKARESSAKLLIELKAREKSN